MSIKSYHAFKSYQAVDVSSEVASASPHKLVQMLFNFIVKNLTQAKLQIQRGDRIEKCNLIQKTLATLDVLRVSLDKESGGSLAENLESLYDYIERQLVVANIKNDAAMIDEALGLVGSIKSAWEQVAPPRTQVQAMRTGTA